MSRVYAGLWSCLLVWYEDGVETFGHSMPASYEEQERLLLLVGQGFPYEGHRVTRALIIPVVTDREMAT